MHSLSSNQKKLTAYFFSLLFFLWLGFLCFNLLSQQEEERDGQVLAASEDVNVITQIYGCILNLTAKPEKRIPAINNWSAELTVEIYTSSNTYLGNFVTNTDNFGQATVNICNEGFQLSGSANYNFYIKGQSNLKKLFSNLPAFEFATTTIDYTPGSVRLINGETSNVYDNKINTLDISTQVTKIGTSDVKNDLNRDGEVNVLDLSNTITNFNLTGDCSPQDVVNGYCL